MGLENTHFFQAAVVPVDPAITIGKRQLSILEKAGISALVSLLRGKRESREYLLRDAQIEAYLGFVEDFSNIVNEELLSDKSCEDLAQKINTSIDHGYNHFRRVEKYKKAIDKEGHELRGNDDYLFFELSSYLAVRFHDLIEVQTKVKEGHDAAAALFTLGYLTQIGTKVIGLLWGKNHELPDDPKLREAWQAQALEEWNKIAWGAAFISLHHSRPGKVSPLETFVQDGLFDPRKILEQVESIARENGKTLTEFFPPFEIITNTIDQIRKGEMHPIKLTKQESQGLVLQTRVVSAADKLDGTYPATLAATRSILTVPDRAFYTRVNHSPGLEQELEQRIRDGGEHMSQCDFNRILFELTRTGSFAGINNIVSYLFRRGLEDRALYFQKAIPAFLTGDFRPYLDGYEEHERESIQSLLVKTDVSRDKARLILNFEDHQNRHKAIRALLEQQGFHGNMFDDLVLHIHLERDQVETALQGKYEKLEFLGLDDAEKQRISTLLQMAIAKQRASLPRNTGPVKMPPIYDGYYWIDMEKWRK